MAIPGIIAPVVERIDAYFPPGIGPQLYLGASTGSASLATLGALSDAAVRTDAVGAANGATAPLGKGPGLAAGVAREGGMGALGRGPQWKAGDGEDAAAGGRAASAGAGRAPQLNAAESAGLSHGGGAAAAAGAAG
eukprot:CAMPEP_0184385598 /NCGR_PEP_ID=MMETSP0007-20130409/9011_1 /TAXON_ID=97485 /ORGANISM="Prymnesium parvum, Strain Texoma1" /LENGTH=135 /DNA_ID=CAMNT_0026733053 /DNA_START=68 /DNA_END=472 /DNA_ORIENTATION=+